MAPSPRLSQGCIQPAQPSSGLNLSASTSATMWGKNTGHHTGRLSIEQDIAAGVLTVDAQQGVKKKPSYPQHGGAQQMPAWALGLQRCASAGSRVHTSRHYSSPKEALLLQASCQPSGLPSCNQNQVPQQLCGFCSYSPHTGGLLLSPRVAAARSRCWAPPVLTSLLP